MPKLEQGDLETVNRLRQKNIPQLVKLIDRGLGYRGRSAFLCLDVQAGASLDVSRR